MTNRTVSCIVCVQEWCNTSKANFNFMPMISVDTYNSNFNFHSNEANGKLPVFNLHVRLLNVKNACLQFSKMQQFIVHFT